MKKVDAVILAVGKGSRIKSYIGSNPKPLVKLGNRSFQEIISEFVQSKEYQEKFINTLTNKTIY